MTWDRSAPTCGLASETAMEGLQVYEATDVIIRGRPIQPDVPCVIQPVLQSLPVDPGWE
jgi:hypothetical protein